MKPNTEQSRKQNTTSPAVVWGFAIFVAAVLMVMSWTCGFIMGGVAI